MENISQIFLLPKLNVLFAYNPMFHLVDSGNDSYNNHFSGLDLDNICPIFAFSFSLFFL